MAAALTSWPGRSERPSSRRIDLGRALGRLRAARPEDSAPVRPGRPCRQESGRQRGPEARGPLTRRCTPGALPGTPAQRPESDRVGATIWRGLHTAEDASGRTARAHVGARGRDSLANVLGPGQPIAPSPLAADEEGARLPSPSISRHRAACARAQAATRPPAHQGVSTLARGLGLLAAL